MEEHPGDTPITKSSRQFVTLFASQGETCSVISANSVVKEIWPLSRFGPYSARDRIAVMTEPVQVRTPFIESLLGHLRWTIKMSCDLPLCTIQLPFKTGVFYWYVSVPLPNKRPVSVSSDTRQHPMTYCQCQLFDPFHQESRDHLGSSCLPMTIPLQPNLS